MLIEAGGAIDTRLRELAVVLERRATTDADLEVIAILREAASEIVRLEKARVTAVSAGKRLLVTQSNAVRARLGAVYAVLTEDDAP